jgi:hypothetical protein
VHAKAEAAPETVRRRVDGGGAMCVYRLYAASCIFVVASVRPALRFALLSTGLPRLGHERACDLGEAWEVSLGMASVHFGIWTRRHLR